MQVIVWLLRNHKLIFVNPLAGFLSISQIYQGKFSPKFAYEQIWRHTHTHTWDVSALQKSILLSTHWIKCAEHAMVRYQHGGRQRVGGWLYVCRSTVTPYYYQYSCLHRVLLYQVSDRSLGCDFLIHVVTHSRARTGSSEKSWLLMEWVCWFRQVVKFFFEWS